MVNEKSVTQELEIFLKELRDYYSYRNRMKQGIFTSQEIEQVRSLRRMLVRKSGKYKKLIAEITGIENVPIVVNNKEYLTDIWTVGLLANPVMRTPTALAYCIDSVGQAIGKLEDDINNGVRDEQGNLIKTGKTPLVSTEQPKAFIVHGGKSGVLEKLREFVEALGIKPLIVEMLPSKGMTLADKVKKYQQEADCAIILATHGGIIDTKSGKQHPRLNVIDELSSFREAFPERVILLLEKGAELASNKSGLTYEPFTRQSMDRAFIAIARELTEMKILKAVKQPKEQNT